MNPAPSKLQPALFGGLFIGVLSALPLVNLANCCCLWVIGGGVLATYLLQQNYPYSITAADGALVGLLAGLIGGAIGVLVAIPIEMAVGPIQQRMIENFILSNPDVPPETKSMIENMGRSGLSGVLILLRLMFSVVIGAIFGMLGGLLGVALFKKKDLPPPSGDFGYPPPPPPGVIDIPPPPPPPPTV
jgi:hypothetical protein